jgi:hypothetical protein
MELEEMMKKQGEIACKVRKRLSGGGRKVQFPVQEKLIARRILQQRVLHVRVVRRDVARFAKDISQIQVLRLHLAGFLDSCGDTRLSRG